MRTKDFFERGGDTSKSFELNFNFFRKEVILSRGLFIVERCSFRNQERSKRWRKEF